MYIVNKGLNVFFWNHTAYSSDILKCKGVLRNISEALLHQAFCTRLCDHVSSAQWIISKFCHFTLILQFIQKIKKIQFWLRQSLTLTYYTILFLRFSFIFLFHSLSFTDLTEKNMFEY